MIKFLEVKRAYYADPENVVVEVKVPAGVWDECVNEPAWDLSFDYRIRPRTIRIGEIDVPEPVRVALNDGQRYYIASTDDNDGYYYATWAADKDDLIWLSRGLIHLTKEAAIAHAKALILVSGGKIDD